MIDTSKMPGGSGRLIIHAWTNGRPAAVAGGFPHLTVVGGTIMVRAMLRRELSPSGGNLNDATHNDGVQGTRPVVDRLRDRQPDGTDRTRAIGGVM
jgi:hypothetical protein